MFKCAASDEKKPDFLPFTLNMRLTTKESARSLYKLLEPIIYSRPDGVPISISFDVNAEQRNMAEAICNIISEQVNNIND